jgi:hypothetical protein
MVRVFSNPRRLDFRGFKGNGKRVSRLLMNTNYGYQEISVKDLFDDATGIPDSLQAIPKERWDWSSTPAKDPILELVGNLRGRGICYPAVKNGKSTIEGILLTTAPVERIAERVRSVCEEHFLSYEIEKSGTHLSIVVGRTESFQPKRELFLFTGRFGEYAGIKFSIELRGRWQWQAKPLLETLMELRGLGDEMVDYKEIQLDGRRSCVIRLLEAAPRQEALLKMYELFDRSGWMPVEGIDCVARAAGGGSFVFRKDRYLASVRIQDNDSNGEETVVLCQVSEGERVGVSA